jgi:hypothetical protein
MQSMRGLTLIFRDLRDPIPSGKASTDVHSVLEWFEPALHENREGKPCLLLATL